MKIMRDRMGRLLNLLLKRGRDPTHISRHNFVHIVKE
jgi:hypothetical protein